MMQRAFALLVCLTSGSLFAQSGGPGPNGGGSSSGPGSGPPIPLVALFVPNESAPPGGLVQMKFMVTEPTPISTGRPVTTYDTDIFDAVWGIELFNNLGDLNG